MCHTTNCYATCGESPYINEGMMNSGSEITLRFIQFDLANLPQMLGNREPTKVTIHAQTIVLTRKLNVPFHLVLVARQVSISGSGSFQKNDKPVKKCVKSTVHLDCSINLPMTLMSFYGEGRIDIYAQGVQVVATACSKGRLLSEVPKFDVTAMQAALACAADIASSSTSGYSQVSLNMLNYVHQAASDLAGFSDANAALATRSTVAVITAYINNRKNGLRTVPLLAQSSYNYMLRRLVHYSVFFEYNERMHSHIK